MFISASKSCIAEHMAKIHDVNPTEFEHVL